MTTTNSDHSVYPHQQDFQWVETRRTFDQTCLVSGGTK